MSHRKPSNPEDSNRLADAFAEGDLADVISVSADLLCDSDRVVSYLNTIAERMRNASSDHARNQILLDALKACDLSSEEIDEVRAQMALLDRVKNGDAGN